MKRSALVAYVSYVVLLKFRKEYKIWLIQGEHSVLALLSVETEKIKGMRNADIGEPPRSLYGYSTFPVLDAGEMIP